MTIFVFLASIADFDFDSLKNFPEAGPEVTSLWAAPDCDWAGFIAGWDSRGGGLFADLAPSVSSDIE